MTEFAKMSEEELMLAEKQAAKIVEPSDVLVEHEWHVESQPNPDEEQNPDF